MTILREQLRETNVYIDGLRKGSFTEDGLKIADSGKTPAWPRDKGNHSPKPPEGGRRDIARFPRQQ